jgi:hypothetical protein
VNAVKPTGGFKSNAYVLFDYQSETDFKFAGIDVSTNKLVIGHRDATGWIVDKQGAVQGSLRSDTNYNIFLSINGTAVTMIVDNTYNLSFTFAPRTDFFGVVHAINDGMVGLGANNSKAQIDNVAVQRLPPNYTFNKTVEFDAGTTTLLLAPTSGTWAISGTGTAARYNGTPGATTPAVDLVNLVIAPSSAIEVSAKLKVATEGGFVFDYYDADRFKFVTISAGKITLGHHTDKGWFVDATYTNTTLIKVNTDLTLGLTLKGSTVNVTINGSQGISFAYNALVGDGNFGLLSRSGVTSFENLTVKSDDPGLSALTVTSMQGTTGASSEVTAADVAAVAAAAVQQWAAVATPSQLAELSKLQFVVVSDLPNNQIAWNAGNGTIQIDATAAGIGWFVDSTPQDSNEFQSTGNAAPTSAAYGKMDLLSALVHEVGHAVGYEHSDGGVMADTLNPGQRRDVIDWNAAYVGNQVQAPAFPVFSVSGDEKDELEPIGDVEWLVEV